MGTTPLHDLPYPEGSDPPAGHVQMRALAEAVDEALPGYRVQKGSATVTHAAAQTASVDVTFPEPFTAPPTIVVTPTRSDFSLGIANVTASGFRVNSRFLAGSSSSSSFAVTWIAVG
jgi:hypothetical protein